MLAQGDSVIDASIAVFDSTSNVLDADDDDSLGNFSSLIRFETFTSDVLSISSFFK